MKLSIVFNGSDITRESPCDSLRLLGDLCVECLSQGLSYHYTIVSSVNGFESTLYGNATLDGEDSHNDALNELTSSALESEGY